MAERTVLVLGGTGRTGRRVMEQLLDRGVRVRAIVRSAVRVPAELAEHPNLTLVEADLLSLTEEQLHEQVGGCDAVISTLGHNISLQGMFGSPRDLVEQAAVRVCSAAESLRSAEPLRFILMSSVSVNNPAGTDTRRGAFEKACVAVLRGVLPPAKDNQEAANFLCREIGTANETVEWAAVRPDTLLEGDVCEYALHDALISSLAKPDSTNMANVAHFMCEMVTDADVWAQWKGKLPVVVNSAQTG